MAEETIAEEALPTEESKWEFTQVEKLEIIDGRYQCMIELKGQEENEPNQPVWDLFLLFDKPLTTEAAKSTILNTAIKNWVLNILNSISWVKWFHTYSDYLVLLGLVDWSDKVRDQLESTFQFSLKFVKEEEYTSILEQRNKDNAEAEAEEKQKAVDLPA